MDPNDARRLELAAKVWRAARPSDREVEQHVVRVARRLRTARRHHPLRRFLAFLVAIVSFGGALAFAASGAGILHWPGTAQPSKKPPSAGGRGAAPAETLALAGGSKRVGTASTSANGAAVPSEAPPPAALVPPEPPAGEAETPQAGDGDGDAPAASSSKGRAGPAINSGAAETRLWHSVSSALAKDDLTTAASALRRLATRGSAETRAKARLGLVQLAVSRGDCAQAERLAKGLAADKTSDDRVVSRALSAARTCFGR